MKIVNKSWGREEWLIQDKPFGLKRLIIRSFNCTSYHYHEIKDECFYVEKGEVLIKIGDRVYFLTKGDTLRIKPMTKHSLFALTNVAILEVSTSELDERVRLGDINEF